jgi:hypothetical protein
VARDVTAAFWDVLIAREFERIAQEAIDQRQRHLDETKKRQAAGTVTDFDVHAAEVGLQNVRPTLIRSANDVRVARDRWRCCSPKPATSTWPARSTPRRARFPAMTKCSRRPSIPGRAFGTAYPNRHRRSVWCRDRAVAQQAERRFFRHVRCALTWA